MNNKIVEKIKQIREATLELESMYRELNDMLQEQTSGLLKAAPPVDYIHLVDIVGLPQQTMKEIRKMADEGSITVDYETSDRICYNYNIQGVLMTTLVDKVK